MVQNARCQRDEETGFYSQLFLTFRRLQRVSYLGGSSHALHTPESGNRQPIAVSDDEGTFC